MHLVEASDSDKQGFMSGSLSRRVTMGILSSYKKVPDFPLFAALIRSGGRARYWTSPGPPGFSESGLWVLNPETEIQHTINLHGVTFRCPGRTNRVAWVAAGACRAAEGLAPRTRVCPRRSAVPGLLSREGGAGDHSPQATTQPAPGPAAVPNTSVAHAAGP